MKFNFKKKFGQNFLTDNTVIDIIVGLIPATENDLIIEVGPGAGALTKKLKQYNANLIAYEIDHDTEDYLLPLEDDKTKIIYDDFLKRDIKNDIEGIKYDNLYIIGNLPYYITTPIITNIINSNLDVKKIVIMIQKEVADRFSARPNSKEYGSITVFLNYFFNIRKELIVSKKKFNPMPNVDSAVISLNRRDNLEKTDFEKFNKLVKDSFQFKRKNLRNNLRNYDINKLEEILQSIGFTLNDRAETLTYEDFVYITNEYYDINN